MREGRSTRLEGGEVWSGMCGSRSEVCWEGGRWSCVRKGKGGRLGMAGLGTEKRYMEGS